MNKIIKCIKDNIVIFFILVILTITILREFFPMHYATDTYVIINEGYREYALNWFLIGGRVFSCLTLLLAEFFNISINTYVISSLIIAIFISCITVILLKNIILKYKPAKSKYQEVFILVVSYFTIFNFTYLDALHFAECSVMAMSILLYILAAKVLVDKSKMHFLKSLILFILAVFSYQGTNGIFFAAVTLFSVIKNKSEYKKIIIDLVKCALILVIGIGLNIIQVNIASRLLDTVQTRAFSIKKITENIMFIFKSIIPRIYIYGCGLFPKYALTIFIVLVIFIIDIYFKKREKNNDIVIQIGIFILITVFSSMLTFIMTKSSFDSGRMHFSVGAFLGMLFMCLYCNTDIFNSNFKYILVSIFTIYACITVCVYIYIIHEHKTINVSDYLKTQNIAEHISDYENETGNSIENVYVIINPKKYKSIPCTLTNSATQSEHSITGIINYYTGRNLKEAKAISKSENELQEDFKCIKDALFINAYIY